MRTIKVPPKRGERRTIRKFVFLPLVVNGTMYWMEFINLHQEYVVEYNPKGNSSKGTDLIKYWKNIAVY